MESDEETTYFNGHGRTANGWIAILPNTQKRTLLTPITRIYVSSEFNMKRYPGFKFEKEFCVREIIADIMVANTFYDTKEEALAAVIAWRLEHGL